MYSNKSLQKVVSHLVKSNGQQKNIFEGGDRKKVNFMSLITKERNVV